jgi:hypothetical protein
LRLQKSVDMVAQSLEVKPTSHVQIDESDVIGEYTGSCEQPLSQTSFWTFKQREMILNEANYEWLISTAVSKKKNKVWIQNVTGSQKLTRDSFFFWHVFHKRE